MSANAGNSRIRLGANNPPEPIADAMSPFEIAEKAVNDIVDEATLWLDGHKIDSKDMADGVGNLLAEIRRADKLAKDARKAEEDPHDDAVKEIRARYAPLIADTKAIRGKTVIAIEACKAALQPWLDAEDARIKQEAAAARAEADHKRQEAEDALRASDAQNLAEREAAEVLLRDAKKADTAANVAARQTATAGGAFGRAIGIRSNYTPELTDPVLAIRHYWSSRADEIQGLLVTLAERDIRAGTRTIPGFIITNQKTAA